MVAYIQSKIRSRQFTRDSLCGELEGEEKKRKGKMEGKKGKRMQRNFISVSRLFGVMVH